ncbi:MAG: 50S ribosomal protein L13 [Candidatus Nomurabacteria bacterium GW2011_GWB1_47_6]|uniref:50S ribosomal protein L13 n=1 Tax=Candidatus Nomurabacteria bacterium GW2011_GWB1_47_6 TaxID=1618749 RepID=A0A0G1T0F6_9BACT|nr:MAG: 50S ribosomal protein L13 [Candidatus Nomurabacteria bacterium GW2011_GWB1_47_6]
MKNKDTKTKASKDSKASEAKTIDAKGMTLGRVATAAAMHLMGKTAATFERHKYSGFPVKIINVGKIRITPKKLETLTHKRYSGIPGGLRILSAAETVSRKGMKELVRLATYQMLPGNKLRRIMMKNLEIEN